MTALYSGFYPDEAVVGAKGSASFTPRTALVRVYRRSTTPLIGSDVPNGNVIYTFATTNIDLSAVTNGWSKDIPVGTSPLWISTATAVGTATTYTIIPSEWVAPSVVLESLLDVGGPLIVGELPLNRAVTGLRNNAITVGGSGTLDGIGTVGIYVNNTTVVPSGTLAARPATGLFTGQQYFATDVGRMFRWNGSSWVQSSDVTSQHTAAFISGQGALATLNSADLGGATTTGTLPVTKAASGLQNTSITIASGVLNGIGTAGIFVDNTRAALQGLASARPASGQFVGQEYHATDTRDISQWDGTSWRVSADITAAAQRSIEAQFPVIEIKQGEAGHTGTRTVTHTAKRGTTTLTGGTWSLPSTNVTGATVTVNATTGTVSLSGVTVSGAYTIRYTHTDGLQTDLPVNVTYVPTPAGGVVSAKTATTTSNTGVGNVGTWSQVIALTVTGAPTGRLFFNNFSFTAGNRINPSTGTGTCEHQARLLINGTVVATVLAQLTVSSGIVQPVDFSALFQEAWPVTAGTVTVSVELQRTSGTGTINTMSNSLDVTIIAS